MQVSEYVLALPLLLVAHLVEENIDGCIGLKLLHDCLIIYLGVWAKHGWNLLPGSIDHIAFVRATRFFVLADVHTHLIQYFGQYLCFRLCGFKDVGAFAHHHRAVHFVHVKDKTEEVFELFEEFHYRPIREDGGTRDVGGLCADDDETRIGWLVKSDEVCEGITHRRDHSADDVGEVWHRRDERFILNVRFIFLPHEDESVSRIGRDVIGVHDHVVVFEVEREQYGVRSFQVAPHHVRHAEAIFLRHMNLIKK